VQKLSRTSLAPLRKTTARKKTPAELEREAIAREEEAQAYRRAAREELTRAFETTGERVPRRCAALPSPRTGITSAGRSWRSSGVSSPSPTAST